MGSGEEDRQPTILGVAMSETDSISLEFVGFESLFDLEEEVMWAVYDKLKSMDIPVEFEGVLHITIELEYEERDNA